MDKKGISEIKKTFTKEKCIIDHITGRFVDEDGSTIAEINTPFHSLQEEEADQYCKILKKILSGKQGKSLYDINFSTQEETSGEKHPRLMRMISSVQDDAAEQKAMDDIVANLDRAGQHLILIAHGMYDIPMKATDGRMTDEASEFVYSFIVTAICPVERVKNGLCFEAGSREFKDHSMDLSVKAPVLGFMFPAFNNRQMDIHQAIYYAKKEDERHPELVDMLFGTELPTPESQQKDAFATVITQTLGRDCTFDNVMAVTNTVNELVKEHTDDIEPMEIGKTEIKQMLKASDVPSETIDHLDAVYDEQAPSENFAAENIGGKSTVDLKSDSMKLSVSADMTSMIKSKTIDGTEYLLIPIQDSLELNGIPILLSRK